MEELWKMARMDYRVGEIADIAEYRKMLQRYRDEEVTYNRAHLLYGDDHIDPPPREA